MLSAAALAAFFLAGSLHAQEPPANTGQPAQTEDSGISTPRRVAGLGVDRLDDLEKRFAPPKGRQPGPGYSP